MPASRPSANGWGATAAFRAHLSLTTIVWISVLAFSLAAMASVQTNAKAQSLNAQTFELANGMKVIYVPDRRLPIVTHMLWYRVGSADEEPGKSGLAHFFEHLMFKGTPANPGDSYARFIGGVGGELNAFTSYDYTAYYATVGSAHLERIMELEADRMVNLALTPQQVAVEREVIVEERRLRTDNNPEALLLEQALASLFLNHRYGIPVIGWMHEIRSWTQEDALSFYRRWYTPSNALLVVSGDIDFEQLRHLATKHYGKLAAYAVTRKRATEPPSLAERRIVMKDPRAGRPLWLRLYLAPSYGTADRPKTIAIEILAELLGGGATGILHRRLVMERRLAADVSASYDPAAIDETMFAINAIPKPGVALEDLERAIDEELNALAKSISKNPADLTRARQKLIMASLQARDGTYKAALAVGAALATGAALTDFERRQDLISAVTPDDIAVAARDLFQPTRSVTSLLLVDR